MTAPDSTADATRDDASLPDNLAEAGFYRTTAEGFDHSLVLLALGDACWLMPSDAGYRLLVESPAAARARLELANYDRESIGWPPLPAKESPARTQLDLVTPLFWAFAVIAVYRGQLSHPDWAAAGALDPAAIFGRHEWWRAATALFLHVDGGHLMSNLFAGVFVFSAMLAVFGRTRGWLLLGLAAVAGNLTVAAIHLSGPYLSMGASTAIFAALGLLTGRAVRIATSTGQARRWRSFFAPAAAGLIVLALYGAGGAQTDVLAHLSGFSAGAILGLVAGRPLLRRPDGA